MKTSRLFGTDGIRGVAGEYPLDAETVFTIGRALGEFLRARGESPRVLMGQDTRESSGWIAETLAGGLAQSGVSALTAGVIPTPGVAYLSRIEGFSAGVMISASHNPYQDNGIKVIAHSGYKLPDEDELEVEEAIFRLAAEAGGATTRRKALEEDSNLRGRYEEFLVSRLSPGFSLAGMKIVVDCANGAASTVAPELFRRLGSEVTVMSAEPDGRNINRDCGSLHTQSLQKRVPLEAAAAGVAFDGDADRAMLVTPEGELVNGDGVLYLVARHLMAERRLPNCMVVGTVMANLGLEVALNRAGIQLVRTPVGDKYVLEEMLRRGVVLGGEQSGHIIFANDHTTGDGILTALKVLETVAQAGQPLNKLVEDLPVFPQVIVNVRVREKVPIEQLPEVSETIASSQAHFGSEGRVVVRYSGTEALARIMVEAASEAEVHEHAERIAKAFRQTLGVP